MKCPTCSRLISDDVMLVLDQIDALVSIAMHSDLNELTPKTTYHFFNVISELIASAQSIH